ncbi:uncharacterized protein JCM15063_006444 [Sporobolomyces koalae]|uniref:uncharacterized protein n=1 Tax=Sporobolomyces koalae TaxID=500713 RepID=UPI00316E15A1
MTETLQDPFQALSTQLVSHGYLSRPLLLSALTAGAASTLPASASSSHVKRHQEQLLLKARAQDQITKLLWHLIERNQESTALTREAVEREHRVVMEFDREVGIRERAERERETVERELEKERARTKQLEAKLKQEQERHKHAREELSKSRNALQFVKTQATHDQKKREQEVTALHLRLSKLTSDPSTSRLQILNASSLASPSNISPTSSNFSRTRRSTPPMTVKKDDASATTLNQAELDLLKTSVQELDETRQHLEHDNLELRTFLGQLNDWIDQILTLPELEKIISPPSAAKTEQDLLEEEEHEDDSGSAEKREVRQLWNRLKANDFNVDESFGIPAPHLSLAPTQVVSQLDQKLYILRVSLSSCLGSIERRIGSTRRTARDAIEREIEARDEAIEQREMVQTELVEAKELLRQGQLLVDQFATTKDSGKQPRRSKMNDDSGDELPTEVVKEIRTVHDKTLNRKKSHKTLNKQLVEPEALSTAPRPSIPSKTVSDFLGSLGLDTPVLPVEKESLKSTQVLRNAHSTQPATNSETIDEERLPAKRPEKPVRSSLEGVKNVKKSHKGVLEPSRTTNSGDSQRDDPVKTIRRVKTREELVKEKKASLIKAAAATGSKASNATRSV